MSEKNQYAIKTTSNTITAHDLQSNKKENKPKFLTSFYFAQIDNKALFAEAYSESIEHAENKDSFIAELDVTKDGLSKEHEEQRAYIEEILLALSAEAERHLILTIEESNKDFTNLLFSTTWTNDRGNLTIRNKYFFDTCYGIVTKELKTSPSRESYTVAQPSIRGLAGFRAELQNNQEEHADNFAELQLLHNNHCLAINGIEPEADIFYDLAEVREDEPTSRFYGEGGIFINFNNGFINAVKNEKMNNLNANTATRKVRDF